MKKLFVILVIATFVSSCSVNYSVSERKAAPIVKNYDVKDIKYQTSHNVSPKD